MPHCKLTEHEVESIRQAADLGASCRHLALWYHVHLSTIYKISRGRTWRTTNGPRTGRQPHRPQTKTPADLRWPEHRWTRLRELLTHFERCVEHCARLDAHMESSMLGEDHEALEAFNRHLRSLSERIDREITNLTVERLRVDLEAKQRRIA